MFVNPKARDIAGKSSGALIKGEDKGNTMGLTMAQANDSSDELLAKFQKLYQPSHVMDHPVGSNVNLKLKDTVFHANLTSIYRVDTSDNLYRNQTLVDELPWGVMVDGSDSILLATDLNGRIIDLNNEAIEKLSPEELSDDVTFAQNHIGRHYTRYLDYADRAEVTKKFDHVVKTGKVPADFENQITLVSNDFNFDDGRSGFDMLVRLHMYPHHDKKGVVAGVVFEGEEVSEQILEAHVANSMFKWDHENEEYDVEKTTLKYNSELVDAEDEDQDSDDEDQYKYGELYNTKGDKVVEVDGMDREYGCQGMRKMHGPMVGLNTLQNIEAITNAALWTLHPEEKFEDICEMDENKWRNQPFTKYLAGVKTSDFVSACKEVEDSRTPIIIDTQLYDGEDKTETSVEKASTMMKFAIAPW